MNVEFTQYLGLGHGAGGNFSRWLDDTRFHYQQVVAGTLGDSMDSLDVSLFLPGPKRGFGEPGIEFSFSKSKRVGEANMRLDPQQYGSTRDSAERIRLLIDALAELTVIVCNKISLADRASELSAKVYGIESLVFE